MLVPVQAVVGSEEEVKLPSISSVVGFIGLEKTESQWSEGINDTLSLTAVENRNEEYVVPVKKTRVHKKGSRLAAFVAQEQNNICYENVPRLTRTEKNLMDYVNSDEEEVVDAKGNVYQKKPITNDMLSACQNGYVRVRFPREEPKWVPLLFVMYKCRGDKAREKVQAKIDELRQIPQESGTGFKKSYLNELTDDIEFLHYYPNGNRIMFKLGKTRHMTTVDELAMNDDLSQFISTQEELIRTVMTGEKLGKTIIRKLGLNVTHDDAVQLNPKEELRWLKAQPHQPPFDPLSWKVQLPDNLEAVLPDDLEATQFQKKRVHFKLNDPTIFIPSNEPKAQSTPLNAGGHPAMATSRMPGGLVRPNQPTTPPTTDDEEPSMTEAEEPSMTEAEAAAFLVSLTAESE